MTCLSPCKYSTGTDYHETDTFDSEGVDGIDGAWCRSRALSPDKDIWDVSTMGARDDIRFVIMALVMVPVVPALSLPSPCCLFITPRLLDVVAGSAPPAAAAAAPARVRKLSLGGPVADKVVSLGRDGKLSPISAGAPLLRLVSAFSKSLHLDLRT